MKKVTLGFTAVLLSTTASFAGGLDRSNLFLGPLWEETGETGNYVELSYGALNPSVSGALSTGGGDLTADPLKSIESVGFAYKRDLSETLSAAIIIDEPFAVATDYEGTSSPLPVEPKGILSSIGVTFVLRQEFGNGFSVHGGFRSVSLDGELVSYPGGTSLGVLDVSSDYDFGYLVGVAYERPEIALRVALTYNSEIDHGLSGTETITDLVGGGTSSSSTDFTTTTPESLNLEFQTGIAQDTLLFGTVRYAPWDGFNVTTPDAGLYAELQDDWVTTTIGIGRRLNDNWSAAITLGYEPEGEKPSSTALAPTTGRQSIGLSARYTSPTGIEVAGGVTYGTLGEQTVFLGQDYDMEDGEFWGAGIRIAYRF